MAEIHVAKYNSRPLVGATIPRPPLDKSARQSWRKACGAVSPMDTVSESLVNPSRVFW
ncbi:hypothetical protein [Limnobaculum parvum]|uniref:hypothetical protein n=1 Tax=Limnobaculum parvum TaxID=2172103 RepID=UPI001300410B|nr:hypothetical protein [Limnobaculum parvum]